MAVSGSGLEGDGFGGPVVDHVGGPGRFWRRILTWVMLTAAALVLMRISLPSPGLSPSVALLALVLGFCCCAALGAAVYCFATFTISREVRDLLAATGFCALCGGAALQVLVDLSGPSPVPNDSIMAAGLVYASAAFCAASFAKMSWRPASRAASWFQLALSWILAVAFPLAALPYAIDGFTLNTFGGSVPGQAAFYGSGSLAAMVAVGLVIAALLGNYRRYRTTDQRVPSIECYFYITYAFALAARAASAGRFDGWWVCSQALLVESWLVFLSATAAENAVAHKEGSDRLAEMTALHDVSWSLVGAQSFKELVNLLAQTVGEKLGAKIVTVYLADEARECLEVAAVSGLDIGSAPPGAKYKVVSGERRPGFHSGHTARAFGTQEPQVAEDVFVDVEFVPWRIIAREDGCAVSLPLVDKGQATGVLNLYFSDRTQVTEQRLRLLKTIAAGATPAIASARASEAHTVGPRELDLAA